MHDPAAQRSPLRLQMAPLAIALGYALARTVGHSGAWINISWPGPFTLSLLVGLVLAFALRPVLTRLPWTRLTAAVLALALLLALGPVADWPLAWLADRLHIAALLPGSATALAYEVAGAAAAAALMGVLYAARGGTIGLVSVRARLGLRPLSYWFGRLTLLASGAVVLNLILGWIDFRWWTGGTPDSAPLLFTNLWDYTRVALGQGVGAAAALVASHWLRALLLFAPMLAVPLMLRARRSQYLLVYAILLFVVGEFAPLMLDQPYFSSAWLVARVALGLVRSIALAAGMAYAFGIPSSVPTGK